MRQYVHVGGIEVEPPRWRAAVAWDGVCGLGEGPVWDAPRSRLLWLDVLAGTVHEGRLAGDRVEHAGSRRFDTYAGAVTVSAAGDLLVAGERSLHVLTADGDLREGPELLAPGTGRRLNDGGCDPAGRFLVGTMALGDPRPGETLLRVEEDGTVSTLDDDLMLSNGLAWTGDTLYSTDTVPGVIHARDYDPVTGAHGPRRDPIRFDTGERTESPDGICLDAEGCLWVAHYGAGEVRRYAPDGALLGVVEVPGAAHTTCPAFVGDGLELLLITTATEGMDAAKLAAYPDSGKTFLVDVGVRGAPVPAWSGP